MFLHRKRSKGFFRCVLIETVRGGTVILSALRAGVVLSETASLSLCVGRLGLVSDSGMPDMLMGKFCARRRYAWNRGNFADFNRLFTFLI